MHRILIAGICLQYSEKPNARYPVWPDIRYTAGFFIEFYEI